MATFKIMLPPGKYRVSVYDPKSKKMYTEWADSRYLAQQTAKVMADKLGLTEFEVEHAPWSAGETSLEITKPTLV